MDISLVKVEINILVKLSRGLTLIPHSKVYVALKVGVYLIKSSLTLSRHFAMDVLEVGT